MPNRDRPLVALIDWSAEQFPPVGFEAERLAEVGADWVQYPCRSTEDVVRVAGEAIVVVVQSVRPLLTPEAIRQLPHSLCMIRAGAGYDSIDYATATEQGVMICNTPTYCTNEVADHAIALLLASVRHVARFDRAVRSGGHGEHGGGMVNRTRRVAGSTLGIIGLGSIGGTVAKRVSGWDMRILTYDNYISDERAAAMGAERVPLETLLRESDLITIHCPLNDETYHLLGKEELALLKPSAIIVNDARGPIIDQQALYEALAENRIWAAGLDVFEQEPLPEDSPLRELDNVILTPHAAAYSPESRVDLYDLICQVSAQVVRGERPDFLRNPEALEHPRWAQP